MIGDTGGATVIVSVALPVPVCSWAE